MEQKGKFARRTGVCRLVHRYQVLLLALILGPTLLTGIAVLAADSDLDPGFDGDGIVTTDYSEFEQVNDMVIQPDGKIVAVGHSGIFHSSGQEPLSMMVARYNIDGSPDTTFGTDGIVTTDIGLYAKAGTVALQADGKIVVAGRSGSILESNFTVVRYHPNGKLDTTFGSGGIVVTTSIGSAAQITDLAIQSDGKIVVAGEVPFVVTMARYNTDGSLDTTFDGDGVSQAIPAGFAVAPVFSAQGIALQMDQKIVVAGVCVVDSNILLCVSRYNSAGSLDSTFDGDGLAITEFDETVGGAARDIAIQPDGKIVVAGESFQNGGVIPAIARYNTDGSLDTSFDSDGKLTTPNSLQLQTNALALQSDGKIVIAGSSFGLVQSISLTRYHSDGSLDEQFGSGGIVTTSIGPTNAAASAVALQKDGRIVAAGHRIFTIDPEAVLADFALVRYGDPPSANINVR